MARDPLSDKALSLLTLQGGEEIVLAKYGNLLNLGTDYEDNPLADLADNPGYLILTSRRLVLLRQKVGILGLKDEYRLWCVVPLEDMQGMSVEKKIFRKPHLNLIFTDGTDLREEAFRATNVRPAYYGTLKGHVEEQVRRRHAEMLRERHGHKVQYVIDFSFLRAEMQRGGLTLHVIKCPSCGANVDLPSEGNRFSCQYCRSTIHAMDVFERVKGLLDGLEEG